MNPTTPAKKKKRISIGNVAALLIATSFTGQLLGFLRTKLVNANFPTIGPHSTDAYFAAFNIPDFFFFTLAAGALGVAFMPVLSDRLHKGDRKGVWELSASLMNLLAIIMAVVAVIMLVFAKPLIRHVVAPGLSPPQLETAATIMRLLAFNPLLFTLSGVLTSVQQTLGRFFFYAIAPLFYNMSIIISIFVFKHNIGLVGLGVGALVGAVVQLLVVICGLWKTGFHWHPHIAWRAEGFHTILRNLPPRSLDQGVDQVENIVETHIASGLGAGNITYYNNAFILSTAPILLIGTAISTAAFPRLNTRLSQGRPDLFRRDFLMVLRAMIWISAPLVVICYFTRGYLARLIYTHGNQQIATIFGFLCLAIFFRILYSIISRWFYAQKDTRTPLIVSLFVIALNVVLAVTLARPSAYGVSGLALAQSIVAMTEVFILSVIMLLRDHRLFDAAFWGGVWRIISVTGFSVVAGFIMISLYPLGANDRGVLTLGSKLLIIATVTFGVHIAVSALFGLEEVRPLFQKVRQLALKPIKVDL
ncbi:MAG TPA: murein biosynthesis integral membrane protein MurJ [Verrucomicrobiae bacterium]|jgi:putative peptidoglycan lipid II flippase|nr:murein biosynthesis integral membrane protein MurJ [Verrucomicrobiae bacterium]